MAPPSTAPPTSQRASSTGGQPCASPAASRSSGPPIGSHSVSGSLATSMNTTSPSSTITAIRAQAARRPRPARAAPPAGEPVEEEHGEQVDGVIRRREQHGFVRALAGAVSGGRGERRLAGGAPPARVRGEQRARQLIGPHLVAELGEVDAILV